MRNKFTIQSFFTILFLVVTQTVFSQHVGINATGASADPSAMLDVSSTSKGLLIPRMTTAQRVAITSPVNGLLVYDTDFNCIFYWVQSGSAWQSMCPGVGPTGPTGAMGATGANGTNGSNGVTGITGAVGATGIAGTNGTNGATGVTGATGVGGTNGTNGTNGVTGATGVAGVNGTNGSNGATGVTGVTGIAGTNGSNGVTGATGIAGTNGTNGVTGVTGATGIAGVTGATGVTGTFANGSAAGNTPYWNGSSWITNGTNFYNNGGNIGIGTTSPGQSLTIDKTTGAANYIGSSIQLERSGNSIYGAGIWQSYSSTNMDILNFGIGQNYNPFSNPVLTIATSGAGAAGGNVGIGTTTPTSLFDINDAGSNPRMRFKLNNASQGFTLGYNNSVPEAYVWNEPNSRMVFGTNNTYRMTIAATGEVGIGTVTPNAKLEVNGTIRIGNDAWHTSADAKYRFYFAANGRTYFGSASGYTFRNAADNVDIVNISDNGRLGLGTTGPNGQLELTLDEGRKPGTNTWTITSDERLKNINGSYTKGLADVLKLNPISYHYKNVGERKFDPKVLETTQIGFSAQEVQKIFPEAVGTDADGYLNFNMHSIIVAYANAIKELDAANKEQAKINKELNERLQKLEAVIKAMNATSK